MTSPSQIDFELQCAQVALENADCDVVKIPNPDSPFQLAARSKSNPDQTWAVKIISDPRNLYVDDLTRTLSSGRAMSLKSVILICNEDLSPEIKEASKTLKINLIDGQNFQQMISELPADVHRNLLANKPSADLSQVSHHEPELIKTPSGAESEPEPSATVESNEAVSNDPEPAATDFQQNAFSQTKPEALAESPQNRDPGTDFQQNAFLQTNQKPTSETQPRNFSSLPEPIPDTPDSNAFAEPEPQPVNDDLKNAFNLPKSPPRTEPRPNAFGPPEPNPTTEPQVKSFAQPEPKPASEPEKDAFTQPEPKPAAQTYSEPVSHIQHEPVIQTEPELLVKPQPEPIHSQIEKEEPVPISNEQFDKFLKTDTFATPSVPPKKAKEINWVKILVGAVILCLVCGLGVRYINNFSKDRNKPTVIEKIEPKKNP